MDEVVVFPWVPATAAHRRVDAMAARTSERATTGTPSRRASASSAFSGPTAGDAVTMSASPTFSARWPTTTVIPWLANRSVTGDALRSLPVTRWPIEASTVAMALMPAPPIPTTWTRRPPEASSAAARSAGMSLHQACHRVGGVGTPKGRCGLAHLGEVGG